MASKKRTGDDAPPAATTRAQLEADRDRLLRGIDECSRPVGDGTNVTDWKTVAALQTQLNGVNRMLLRISGETAPSDVSLIRSPQWGRLFAKLADTLSTKHPKAWAELVRIAKEESR